jgi:hypothetical protein
MNHTILGSLRTNLEGLINSAKNKMPINLVSAEGKMISSQVIVKEASPLIGPSFLHKVEQGFRFSFVAGIDCSFM